MLIYAGPFTSLYFFITIHIKTYSISKRRRAVQARGSKAWELWIENGWSPLIFILLRIFGKNAYFIAIDLVSEIPIPRSKLNNGPAMQPVIANSPKPSLETAKSATRSPIEFPRANKVRPRNDGLTPLM